MSNNWTEGDVHLVYQVAHHDLWWAKGQLWTATNWALALLAALVGAGGLLLELRAASLGQTWPLVVLSAVITFAATVYLAILHHDIVVARRTIRRLLGVRSELQTLDSFLDQSADPDTVRGLVFVGALLLAVSIALGISVYVLGKSCWLASGLTVVNIIIGVVSLGLAVRRGAA